MLKVDRVEEFVESYKNMTSILNELIRYSKNKCPGCKKGLKLRGDGWHRQEGTHFQCRILDLLVIVGDAKIALKKRVIS